MADGEGHEGFESDQARRAALQHLLQVAPDLRIHAAASMKHTAQGETNENGISDDDNDGEWLPSGAAAPQSKSTPSSSSSPTSVKPLEADAEAPDPPPEKLYSIVQCDHCGKWHNVPSSVDAESLPDLWFCSMNTWEPGEARCDLRRKMGVVTAENADEPFALFEKGEWLAYAREIAKFVSACKAHAAKTLHPGARNSYLEVRNEAGTHADVDI